jgi:crotonobetainyl-CoA:carnitine CoA-transferase CaiB-like acyl-CoA transferase
MALLQRQGVAAGVVQNAHDLAQDPQLKQRGFFVELEETVSDANPIRLAETPPRYSRPAPSPGRDNDYVYGGLLGLTEAEMTKLKEEGVI